MYLIIYFANNYSLHSKSVSESIIKEYSNLAKNIWNGDGLTNMNIKEIKIKNKNNIDTSLIYTQVISSIDYTKVSVEIILKSDIKIIKKNNVIFIYFNNSKSLKNMRNYIIKVTFEDEDIKNIKSSYKSNSFGNILLKYYIIFMATMLSLVCVEYIKMKIRQRKIFKVKL